MMAAHHKYADYWSFATIHVRTNLKYKRNQTNIITVTELKLTDSIFQNISCNVTVVVKVVVKKKGEDEHNHWNSIRDAE